MYEVFLIFQKILCKYFTCRLESSGGIRSRGLWFAAKALQENLGSGKNSSQEVLSWESGQGVGREECQAEEAAYWQAQGSPGTESHTDWIAGNLGRVVRMRLRR